jgi:hypothetical protein
MNTENNYNIDLYLLGNDRFSPDVVSDVAEICIAISDSSFGAKQLKRNTNKKLTGPIAS